MIRARVAQIAVGIFSLGLGVALAELCLRAAFRYSGLESRLFAYDYTARTLPDAKLGVKGDPMFREHDSRGYRNPRAVDSADIVLLGDSQVYGSIVSAPETLPRWLERKTAQQVYGMAIPGWCAVQALTILPEAIRLHPREILWILYVGNDFAEAASVVYRGHQFPNLQSRAGDFQNGAQPTAIDRYYSTLSGIDLRFPPTHSMWQNRHPTLAFGALFNLAWERLVPPSLGERWAPLPGRWEEFKRLNEGRQVHFVDHGGQRTVLLPKAQLVLRDIRDPEIREGIRITLDSISRMKKETERVGIRYSLVLWPGKEQVLADLVERHSSELDRLADNDSALWDQLTSWLRSIDLPFFDALPVFRKLAESGSPLYTRDFDDHAREVAIRTLAGELALYLRH